MKFPIERHSERRQLARPSELVRGMNEFQRGIDQLFDDVFSSWSAFPTLSQFPLWSAPLSRDLEQVFAPQCDIEEHEDQYLMTFDLPGVSKEDLHVDVTENMLTVTAERKTGDWEEKPEAKGEEKEGRRSRRLQERFYGRYQRSFTLPPNTDIDHMEAQYENGVLTLHVPKAPAQKARRIQIQEGVAAPRAGLATQAHAESSRPRKTGT
jgi:HSP20 family protein